MNIFKKILIINIFFFLIACEKEVDEKPIKFVNNVLGYNSESNYDSEYERMNYYYGDVEVSSDSEETENEEKLTSTEKDLTDVIFIENYLNIDDDEKFKYLRDQKYNKKDDIFFIKKIEEYMQMNKFIYKNTDFFISFYKYKHKIYIPLTITRLIKNFLKIEFNNTHIKYLNKIYHSRTLETQPIYTYFEKKIIKMFLEEDIVEIDYLLPLIPRIKYLIRDIRKIKNR